MKRARRMGEGWLIAIAVAALLALALGIRMDRRPREITAPPVHSVDAQALWKAERIDVNSASAAELEELPGIGPALAEAIIQYREEHGSFESIEELDQVPGIGPAKIEAVRPYIRLE